MFKLNGKIAFIITHQRFVSGSNDYLVGEQLNVVKFQQTLPTYPDWQVVFFGGGKGTF